MRELYHKVLKKHFCASLVRTRGTCGRTQSYMAEKLAMDDRSYSDLERGISCCSAVTLALYLAYACDDPQDFIEGLRHAVDRDIYEKI